MRRIEAVTGRGALDLFRAHERELQEIEHLVRAPAGQAVRRVQTLVEDRRVLEKRLDDVCRPERFVARLGPVFDRLAALI